ncbi:hypothetical protein [Caproiciproducens galactitolivorans]|uniref:Uncharacterized protein n=1 Tax=Caproiciproducens galactitolivorans TaxID=642589 RepID=A0ABT4BQ72_9FIRM|nr:hypothetical protein [Caproiciproducens galactitolivorans]MCY1713057.1 hypothetical protein [Caproiciproducens galactitolivorans]
MAFITNIEKNLKLEISLKKNSMFDYNPQRSDHENWIPFILCLTLPQRCSMIDESANATMTIYEIKNLIHGVEGVLEHLDCPENYVYNFYNSEGFFGLELEVIPEDNVVEIKLWINVGNQTKGEIFGYDEGVRFVSGKKELIDFLVGIKQEIFWD